MLACAPPRVPPELMPDDHSTRTTLAELGLTGVAAKRLSASEAYRTTSKDRGLQGVRSVRELLGAYPRRYPATFIALIGDAGETIERSAIGAAFWHDPRAGKRSRRPEPRAYLSPPFLHQAGEEGDLAILIRHDSQRITLVVAQPGSSWEQQLLGAFGLAAPKPRGRGTFVGPEQGIDIVKYREVLESIGIRVPAGIDAHAAEALERACRKEAGCGLDELLASNTETKVVSAIARAVTAAPGSTADEQLVAWLGAEEALYYLAEEACYRDQVAAGFESVSEMLEFAKAPLQRRRSRAGHSLENHFRHLLRQRGIPHAPSGSRTEQKSTPDVLVPGKAAYDDPSIPDDHLTMVALKRTCKDRWRQVLREANRVERKFLLTVDPGLSGDQVAAMLEQGLRLVVPSQLHGHYEPSLRRHLMTVEACLTELERIAALHAPR
jgi:hypothetical protein